MVTRDAYCSTAGPSAGCRPDSRGPGMHYLQLPPGKDKLSLDPYFPPVIAVSLVSLTPSYFPYLKNRTKALYVFDHVEDLFTGQLR